MSRETDLQSLVGAQIIIGTSAIVGVTVTPGQLGGILKYSSGGTLWVGGASLTWGNGYLVTTNEALSLDVVGTYYLAAAGATVVAYSLRGRSGGFDNQG